MAPACLRSACATETRSALAFRDTREAKAWSIASLRLSLACALHTPQLKTTRAAAHICDKFFVFKIHLPRTEQQPTSQHTSRWDTQMGSPTKVSKEGRAEWKGSRREDRERKAQPLRRARKQASTSARHPAFAPERTVQELAVAGARRCRAPLRTRDRLHHQNELLAHRGLPQCGHGRRRSITHKSARAPPCRAHREYERAERALRRRRAARSHTSQDPVLFAASSSCHLLVLSSTVAAGNVCACSLFRGGSI